MDAIFNKTLAGLAPADEATAEWLQKIKVGQVVKGKFSQLRNYQFHRKYFAMLNVAFEYWEPGEINCKYGQPEKNFDRFREDLQILAGYSDIHHRLDGSFRVVSKSISFGTMNNDEFTKVYNAVLNVILQRIMAGMSAEEFNRILEFA